MTSADLVHAALAHPLRRQILDAVRASRLDLEQLADRLAAPAATLRRHLAMLEDASLIVSEPQPRDGPGRPRLAYRATGNTAALTDDTPGYRLLATMLAGWLAARTDDPDGVARTIGEAWGHHLVDRPEPFDALDPPGAVDRLVSMLDDLGFAPQLDTTTPSHPHITLRRCPFLDVARDHQDVVCAVHLGLMRGALAELGVAVQATGLRPFVAPDRCITDLEIAA